MTQSFHKFPKTPHLLWLGGGAPRDDKIMSPAEAEAFLSGPVVVEEKVDGANLGLSVGPDGRIRAQSRGDYLAPGRSHAQWNLLWPWLAKREPSLVASLGDKRMLFGEWCYARHSIAYDALPDWFLAFDIFEPASGDFWSSDRRDDLAAELEIATVPTLFRGRLGAAKLPGLIGKSAIGAARMEGIYLRRERAGLLLARAKIVDTTFVQQMDQHWTKHSPVANRLAAGAASPA